MVRLCQLVGFVIKLVHREASNNTLDYEFELLLFVFDLFFVHSKIGLASFNAFENLNPIHGVMFSSARLMGIMISPLK